MKSTTNDLKRVDNKKYPYLGENIVTGSIVLFSSKFNGMILSRPSMCNYIGEYRGDWIEENFRYISSCVITFND